MSILMAKQNLRGSIDNLASKVSNLRRDLQGQEGLPPPPDFSGGGPALAPLDPAAAWEEPSRSPRSAAPKPRSPHQAPKPSSPSLPTRTGTRLFSAGPASAGPASAGPASARTPPARAVTDDTERLMSLVSSEVSAERSSVGAEMRRLAIRSTEEKLNAMRRGHVEELEALLGTTILNVGGSLVTQDGRQMEQVRQALESKRDEMIAAEREGIYASLEVGVRALEKMQEGRIRQHEREAEVKARAELERRLTVKERELRLNLADEELGQTVAVRIEEIKASNEKETRRVFGELAQALEVGASKNLAELKERKENERKAKEAHLVAHSEKVVGEAMEQLAGELLEQERAELAEIRQKCEEERLASLNATRTEGTEALVRAIEAEKERLRKTQQLAVEELREELQGKAMRDLQELTDALDGDLKTAEGLMIDSVKSGLAASLQEASEDHKGRESVDEKTLEALGRKLKVRRLALVKELPKYVEGNRLRQFGELHAGGAEFRKSEGELEEMEKNVNSGRTGLALHVLQEQYEKLASRQEAAGGMIADSGASIRALRKELKEVDPDTYALYYGGTGRENPDVSTDGSKIDVVENILNHSFRTVDREAFGRGERVGEDDVGGGGGACVNCQKLYNMNGELLREINEYQQ